MAYNASSIQPSAIMEEDSLDGQAGKALHPNYKTERTTPTSADYSISDGGAGIQEKSSRGPARVFKKFRQLEAQRKRALVKRFAYTLTGVVLIIIWIGVMLVFSNQEKKYADENKNREITGTTANNLPALPNDAVLQGTLRQFDLASRTLTVQWSGWFLSANGSTLIPLGANTGDPESLEIEVSIYQDQRTVPDTNVEEFFKSVNYTDSEIQQHSFTTPPFALFNRSATRIGYLGVNAWDSIDTDIDLAEGGEGVWHQPLFGYPFDLWSGSATFAAVLPSYVANSTGLTQGLNLNNSGVYPIGRIAIVDSILNWEIQATSVNTCGDNPKTSCELRVTFTAKRPAIVIFCVIIVVIINWLSTLAIFALTCESVFMERPHILEEIDILGVCFSALFALPSVRSLLPAAPDFAAIIDLIGILPNVIIISLCTTIVAFDRIVNRKVEGDDKED